MTDNKPNNELGVVSAVLKRFEKFRLPRLLHIKANIDKGATLSDSELAFLNRVIEDSHNITHLVDHKPKYQKLLAQAIALHKEIVEKALDNEKQAGAG